MRYRKTTGIWFIVNGFANMITWILLVIFNQVPEIKTMLILMIFHWCSELSCAVIGIIGGIMVLRQHVWHRKIYYLASGMSLPAIAAAIAV